MPVQLCPGTNTQYMLLAYDSNGAERSDDPSATSGYLSNQILKSIEFEPFTDIFISSHGWHADVRGAVQQYDRWICGLTSLITRESLFERRPNFRPLYIGLHWPSLAWGDEELSDPINFAPGVEDPLVEAYMDRLGSREGLKPHLQVIITHARANNPLIALPKEVSDAYKQLNLLLPELSEEGIGKAPGHDRERFDPDAIFDYYRESASFGVFDRVRDAILAPLRQLSFWKMKDRARTIGERGVYKLISEMINLKESRDIRIHLSGHSFGSIVVTSAALGAGGVTPHQRAINSIVLVQAALSHWSFSPDIPVRRGTSGFFQSLLNKGVVEGPIVVTRSKHDRALSQFYPLGASIARQVSFNPSGYPVYGALGVFGAQGTDVAAEIRMLPASEQYKFEPGKLYNVDSADYIDEGGGLSGAHNDVDGPEMAHLILQAASPLAAPVVPNFAPSATLPPDVASLPVSFGLTENGQRLQEPNLGDLGSLRNRIDLDVQEVSVSAFRTSMLKYTHFDAAMNTFSVEVGRDPQKLNEVGWGIIFAATEPRLDDIKIALKPLLDLRRSQATGIYFKVFEKESGYRPGETAAEWLARQGNGPTVYETVNPDQGVPFFLLIVGSPEQIPYNFQHKLDINWAVGRIYFENTAEYKSYAESVVRYEQSDTPQRKKRISIFATKHDGDAATPLFHDNVARPLCGSGGLSVPVGQNYGFKLDPYLGTAATKAALSRILRDTSGSSVLFSGSHGMEYPKDDPRQKYLQGAVVCQDWTGGDIVEEHLFSSRDLPADISLEGLVYFQFACHGGGWSRLDPYRNGPGFGPFPISGTAQVSALPQAMLSHAKGGALAVIAHIDRAFAYSFQNIDSGHYNQVQGLSDVLKLVMAGTRIGVAMDKFNLKWGAIATELADSIFSAQADFQVTSAEEAKLFRLWAARDDARNYLVLGDPAVKLQVDKMSPG